ncbi:MAG: hypothetical protein HY306_09940 [Nitrosomonadales bacterium]|nr:hypothetical protein [Nitrosomonadales bacterium]
MQTSDHAPAAKRRLWPKLLTLALILGFAAIAAKLLPRGYSQDFSVIGKGSNVMVLVHDHNTVGSMETMNAMHKTRDDYDSRVEFLVADRLTPEGEKFMLAYGINSVALVFFSPNGEKLNVIYEQQNEALLRKNLNAVFHF